MAVLISGIYLVRICSKSRFIEDENNTSIVIIKDYARHKNQLSICFGNKVKMTYSARTFNAEFWTYWSV